MKQPAPRVTVCWIAVAALLVNLLLPAALSIGLAGERDTVAASLCGATAERDRPGKANLGIVVHHCPICTVAAALTLPCAGALTYAGRIAVTAYPVVRPTLAPAFFRHSPVQARAPPIAT